MIAKKLINGDIIPLKPGDTGAFALCRLGAGHLPVLPVVDGTEFIGLISEKVIQASGDPQDRIGNYELVRTVQSIGEGQNIYELIKIFSASGLNQLPVLSDQNEYLGLIMLQDLVRAIGDMAGVDHPGGVIILEVNEKDFSMSDLVQVIESNETKIISCFVATVPGTTMLEITVKVDRVEIGPLLQAFFRLNYFVTASWATEDTYSEGLKDRFDSLMNYLSI